MSEKQRMLYRLCGEILDIHNPSAGQAMDEKTMALLSLAQAAAFVRILYEKDYIASMTEPMSLGSP